MYDVELSRGGASGWIDFGTEKGAGGAGNELVGAVGGRRFRRGKMVNMWPKWPKTAVFVEKIACQVSSLTR